MKINFMLGVSFVLLFGSWVIAEDRVPIAIQSATATSTLNNQLAEFAIDGITENASRWVSQDLNSQHRLTLEFGGQRTIEFVKVAMGWSNSVGVWTSPIQNFYIQYRDAQNGGAWTNMDGASVTGNTRSVVTIIPDALVSTDSIRIVSDDDGYVRIAEIYVFDNSTGELPIVALERPEILVNQSGYDIELPKRFTTPGIDHGVFEIIRLSDQSVVWNGAFLDGRGDFTGFRPKAAGEEYMVRIAGYLRSDPFRIEPYWMERVCLEPAFRFFVDARSVIGDVPSAYGADAWRDSAYYCYDVQSLILNYLANPSYYEQMPIEIDYAAQKAMVLDPGFQLVTNQNAEDAVEVARTYYNDFDPPVGDQVPDMIQLLHWGFAYLQIKTQDWDYASDPAGRQLHTQHVEKFAFFLYAFPHFQQYFTQQYYDDALQFALDNWDGESGNLFEVIPTDILNANVVTSTFKGRNCPGHSILPNLMMYEVAQREGLANAEQFFDAAFNQTEYIISNFSPDNARLTKGQRMSEHQLPSGLFAFMRMYPDRVPSGLQAWIDQWVDVMIARSDNAYDFRRFGFFENVYLWTIPRFGDESTNGGSGWNEPGNVACVPGILTAMGSQSSDPAVRDRLDEIAVAHWDALFGRNPTGWHSSFNGPDDFVGVERGWQKDFNPNAGARLHGVRGTLNSVATHEHYPNQFDSGFLRHAEGWTAFNAGFNVSLAMQCWDRAELLLTESTDTLQINLVAPVLRPTATVYVTSGAGDLEKVVLVTDDTLGTRFSGSIGFDVTGAPVEEDGVLTTGGQEIAVEYGRGFFGNRIFGMLPPANMTVAVGYIVAGDVGALAGVDKQLLELRANYLGPNADSVVVELESPVPATPGLQEILMQNVSSTNTLGVERKIELFNHGTNQYDVVSCESESVGMRTLTTTNVGENVTNYIGQDQIIRSRVSWRATGPVLLFPWRVDWDSFKIQLKD